MSEQRPRVSFAIPVYNGEATIARAIESALAQTFSDIEVVVADNCSTDDTAAICTRIAERDPRLRYIRNEQNIGLNNNFRRVAEYANGELFRWLGDDDWLEPGYAAACVAALDASPEAVAVTTYQEHVEDDGTVHYTEYKGERITAGDPMERLDQMLKLLTTKRTVIDPMYTMMRREVVEGLTYLTNNRFSDLKVACEMAIAGPWVHVPENLAARNFEEIPKGWHAFGQYTGRPTSTLRGWTVGRSQRVIFCSDLARRVARMPGLSISQRLRGWRAIASYYWRLRSRQVRRRLRRLTGKPAGV